jgi:hypothetical protein
MSNKINNNLFYHNDKFYFINKIKYETSESHMKRVSYILNNLNKKPFDELEKLSLIWINSIFFKCKYNDDVMKIL